MNKLKLRDFGVFNGEHSIDLTPRVKYNRKRPIILFGGLNGAGKTTTLTAIRLALYGRASLGRNVSVQAYHEQLIDYVHKPRKSLVPPHSSSVELSFTYGKHGTVSQYTVIRNWENQKNKVIECLEIKQDGKAFEGLSSEQLQSFLNELIPLGVADLFFFDGERIAELAEDSNNESLAYAIKRLLGLDIIDRLRADLGIYLKEHTQSKLPKEITKEIKDYEKRYTENYASYQKSLTKTEALKTQLVHIDKEIEAVTLRINDLGGAWAQSRQAEELRSEHLIKERTTVTNELKELFSDALPFAFAPKSVAALIDQLKQEQETKNKINARRTVSKHLNELKRELSKCVDKRAVDTAIEKVFGDVLSTRKDTSIVHDISDNKLENTIGIVGLKANEQAQQAKKLSLKVESIQKDLETIGKNIARAPDQSRIASVLEELNSLHEQKVVIEKNLTANSEITKKHLRDSMENVRRLRDLNDRFKKSKSFGEGIELASNTRIMLEEFGEKTKLRKLKVLEQEFIKSFSKLARKDDMKMQATIDPKTFAVTLIDTNGKSINKRKLSAGEKQIYAIAMLEALGRTSGRNLPVIIDTPLGRLDSKHRANLVRNYFPTASHQVLILSTDTEIDETFYGELSPEVSHAFSVDYDSKQGNSRFNEGYFWRQS